MESYAIRETDQPPQQQVQDKCYKKSKQRNRTANNRDEFQGFPVPCVLLDRIKMFFQQKKCA